MSTILQSSQPQKLPINRRSLLQLILSLVAAFLLFAVAFIFALTGLVRQMNQGSANIDLTRPFMIAGSLAFTGILLLPSAWYAWRHIAFPKEEPTPRAERRYLGLILTIIIVVVVGGALALGNFISQNNRISWFLLPPLNIIAIGLPTLWVVFIGSRGLIPGAPRRRWGVFATGLVLGPLISVILELFLIIGVGILAIIWIALNPSLVNEMNSIATRMQFATPSPTTMFDLLIPLILNPGILILGFATISLFIPIIEETFKPIGMWFIVSEKITTAQGFGYGVLCGAGFGLFESLGYTSGGSATWAIEAGARISTLLLHSFTAGLVGWGLASAWSQKRYVRLGIAYAVAIIIHGSWNAMSILSNAGSLQGVTSVSLPANLQQIGSFASIGIIALGVLVLALFFGINRSLRHSLSAKATQTSIGQTPANLSDIPYQSTKTAESSVPPTPEIHPAPPGSEPQHTISGENSNSLTDTLP